MRSFLLILLVGCEPRIVVESRATPSPPPPPDCTSETDAEFCAAEGVSCWTASGTDNCGTARTVASCGTCAGALVCNHGACVDPPCVPESDAVLCSANAFTCGPLVAKDNCGNTRTVACGSCSGVDSCGGGGTAGACGCTPETDAAYCSAQGFNCGSVSWTDNCGQARTADCGACGTGSVCGGPGWPANVCTPCGGDGQMCCPGGNGSCSGASSECFVVSGTYECLPCGGKSETCCYNNGTITASCDSGLSCVGGGLNFCDDCGYLDGPCCGGTSCYGSLHCQSLYNPVCVP